MDSRSAGGLVRPNPHRARTMGSMTPRKPTTRRRVRYDTMMDSVPFVISASLGWRHMPQHARPARAGRRRQISRPAEDRLVTKESEGDGLLRFPVEEELVEQHDRTRLHPRREPLDERGILRPAPRDHELRVLYVARPAGDPAANRLPRQRGRGGNRVVLRTAAGPHPREQPIGVLDAESLAPRALGRRLIEIRIRDQLLEQLLRRPPA